MEIKHKGENSPLSLTSILIILKNKLKIGYHLFVYNSSYENINRFITNGSYQLCTDKNEVNEDSNLESGAVIKQKKCR